MATIRHMGRRSVPPVQADVAVECEVETIIPRAVEELGPLTALANNASIYEYDQPDTATRASWHRHMAINLRAPLVLTRFSSPSCQTAPRATSST
jgi:NAD(P)-dependent dehydrogenase (short-subunit alcohol dehydrogenase family)